MSTKTVFFLLLHIYDDSLQLIRFRTDNANRTRWNKTKKTISSHNRYEKNSHLHLFMIYPEHRYFRSLKHIKRNSGLYTNTPLVHGIFLFFLFFFITLRVYSSYGFPNSHATLTNPGPPAALRFPRKQNPPTIFFLRFLCLFVFCFFLFVTTRIEAISPVGSNYTTK